MNLIKEIVIPIKTVSEANLSEHWSIRYKRHKKQSGIIKMFLRTHGKIELPCTITLIRRSKRMLDSDNLTMSLKNLRDTIADYIIPGLAPGRADDNKSVTWQYDQVKGDPAVIVQIFPLY